jgi:ABC-2 type transport system ATP-binding protein
MIVAGRVAAAGTPGDLMAGDRDRLRFRLAAELTGDDIDILGGALGGAVDAEGDRRYRLGSAADPATIATLARWCAERGIVIVEMRSTGSTLEERYLELVRGGADG